LAPDGSKCQFHAPDTLPPGKEPQVPTGKGCLIGHRAGVDVVWRILEGIKSIVQPTACHFTDWAIPSLTERIKKSDLLPTVVNIETWKTGQMVTLI